MGTQAVYTFFDEKFEYHIYGNFDGYPTGAYDKLIKMIPFAWPLPRFEANDIAAAFIAGNKQSGGNIFLTKHWNEHGYLNYRYEITKSNENATQYYIKAFEYGTTYKHKINTKDKQNNENYKLIFEGTLEEFKNFCEKNN